MKKITIVVLHLGYGGIEKAVASLANSLCDDYRVNIISTYKLYDEPAFKIDPKVNISYVLNVKPNKKEFLDAIKAKNIFLAFKEGLKSLKVLLLKKYKMIKSVKNIDSDYIISTVSYHNKMVGKYSKKDIVKIAWEHSHHNNRKKYINSLVKSCKHSNYLVTVSKNLNNFYKNKLKGTNTKCVYIPLGLDLYPEKGSSLSKKNITAIGRLSKEKGFSDLIYLFKKVVINHPLWHLNIVGDGLEKEKLIEKIIELDLTKNITMHGFKNKDQINDILLDTSIYIMTSYTESFGLVLIEAMSYGIPCISYSSAQGALEIIDNGVDGFLVKNRNEKLMLKKISHLIEKRSHRKEMGKKALTKSKEFSLEKSKENWIKLLKRKV